MHPGSRLREKKESESNPRERGMGTPLGPSVLFCRISLTHYLRDVAQFGRALLLGSRGRRFESCHPDCQNFWQHFSKHDTMALTSKFKKDLSTLREAAEGTIFLDVKNPKLFKKVKRFYQNNVS